MNSACCRIYNDNIGAGPVLRDLHVLRKEWQTVSSASSFLWEIKDSLGWPPLSKVLGVSTLKALLTSTLETSLFPSMWSLLFISEKPLQQTHPSPRQPLPNGTVQIFWTVSGLFWCFVSGHLLALGWHSVHVQSSTSVTKIDWPTLTFVFCNHCCLWFKKKKKKKHQTCDACIAHVGQQVTSIFIIYCFGISAWVGNQSQLMRTQSFILQCLVLSNKQVKLWGDSV